MPSPRTVALISLEPWDDVWRRNQHLASRLVRQRLLDHLVFICPPSKSGGHPFSPEPGIEVVVPPLLAPARAGGLKFCAHWLRRNGWMNVDALWINHAALGVQLLDRRSACYDVTDDWRQAQLSPSARRRLLRAEAALASSVPVVVCSSELQKRWRDRYGVQAAVVQNGVDTDAVRSAAPIHLDGAPPHVGYVGTLQSERLDVGLVMQLGDRFCGTVHLVGPDHLDAESRRLLHAQDRIRIHGPVSSTQVPSWLVSMDVLLLPHRVTPFTLSLDAIKAHEYLATDRAIVATPTSGFQEVQQPGVVVVPASGFTDAVLRAAPSGDRYPNRPVGDWAIRATEFARVAWGAQ